MLTCTVFTDKDGQFSKLIISPEISEGSKADIIEIQITNEQAAEIKALELLSNDREG